MKPKPKKYTFSEFMRNASPEEQERVFMKVIDGAIEDQKAIMRRADEIIAEREKNKKMEAKNVSSQSG